MAPSLWDQVTAFLATHASSNLQHLTSRRGLVASLTDDDFSGTLHYLLVFAVSPHHLEVVLHLCVYQIASWTISWIKGLLVLWDFRVYPFPLTIEYWRCNLVILNFRPSFRLFLVLMRGLVVCSFLFPLILTIWKQKRIFLVSQNRKKIHVGDVTDMINLKKIK